MSKTQGTIEGEADEAGAPPLILNFVSSGPISRQDYESLFSYESERPLTLIIAGLDSGGGAGLSADTLTVYDLGAYPLNCETALTAQSLKRVAAVEPVQSELFEQTLTLLLEDFGAPAAIKVGLISSAAVLEAVLRCLKDRLPQVPVVWDPVLNATAGRLDSADLKKELARILPLCEVFTPNYPEALELAALPPESDISLSQLGEYFLERGARHVIIKGGHRGTVAGETDELSPTAACIDYCCSKDKVFALSSPKVAGDGAHGGGCALSSALAASLAQGYSFEDAAVLAKAYVYSGILKPALTPGQAQAGDRAAAAAQCARPPLGHHGLPRSLALFPRVLLSPLKSARGPFASCPASLGLYPIVDSACWVERLCEAGVRTVQLRIKDAASHSESFKTEVRRACEVARAHHARLFIDDYPEVALECGAYGVHLGMEDLCEVDPALLERVRAGGLRLGVSTHGLFELLQALALQPSYVALGHIFPTNSKAMPSRPQGLKRLSYEASLLRGQLSCVAIGGITEQNVQEVLKSGVGAVALISAITKAADPEAVTRRLLTVAGSGGDEP
ncbi:MAG: thiamine phosphate synthase [Succinivibrio sp.]|nr:thiamine phosphate synthase [Succinivibrio sp.]